MVGSDILDPEKLKVVKSGIVYDVDGIVE